MQRATVPGRRHHGLPAGGSRCAWTSECSLQHRSLHAEPCICSSCSHSSCLHNPRSQQTWHRRPAPRRTPGPVAALSGDSMQDFIVGSSLATAIGAAIFYGAKGEPEICEGCAGQGGVKCFACEGSGRMEALPQSAQQQRKRDIIGRQQNASSCRVCQGSGLILCKRCGGSGYQKRMS